MHTDIYRYAGQIRMNGYEALCDAMDARPDKSAERALLIIGTPGGDPDAGFRIARALQHTYPKSGFDALIPRYCKSAGTLVLLGAKKLYMADRSELGPLDIQIKKGDELFGRNSGLDINQAVDFLKEEAVLTFNSYMLRLVRQGLSTKVATDIATKLVNGLFNPIAAQIEPLRLAEMQRATTVTYAYGQRLAEVGGNVASGGMETLVGGYPSHGFVIDRREARAIFKVVESPKGELSRLCYDFHRKHEAQIDDLVPYINVETKELKDSREGAKNGSPDHQHGTSATNAGANEPIVDGDGRANPARPPTDKPATAKRGKARGAAAAR